MDVWVHVELNHSCVADMIRALKINHTSTELFKRKQKGCLQLMSCPALTSALGGHWLDDWGTWDKEGFLQLCSVPGIPLKLDEGPGERAGR